MNGQPIDYKAFFDLGMDMFCVANEPGYFVHLNRAWETTLGYSLPELMAKPFIEFVHPEDRDATLEAADQLKSAPVVQFVNRYLDRTGKYRSLSWSASKRDERNLTYAVARDVTAIKNLESYLRARLTLTNERRVEVSGDILAINRLVQQFITDQERVEADYQRLREASATLVKAVEALAKRPV